MEGRPRTPSTLVVVPDPAVDAALFGTTVIVVRSCVEAEAVLATHAVFVAVITADALGADPTGVVRACHAAYPRLAVIVAAQPGDDAFPPPSRQEDVAATGAGATFTASEEELVAAGAHQVVVVAPGDRAALVAVVGAASRWAQRLAEDDRLARRSGLLHASAAEGYAVLDPDGAFLYGGRALPGGRAIDAVVGTSAFDWIAPRDVARAQGAFAGVAAEPGATAELEVEVTGLGGARRFLEIVLTNLCDEDAIGGIVCTYWDITARRLAEEALAFHSALLDAVGQAVIAIDPSHTIVYWNPAARELYGWTRDEAVGQALSAVLGTSDSPQAGPAMATVRRGERWSGEFAVRRRDGTVMPVWVTDTPVYGQDGSLIAVIGVSTDLSERKRAEATQRHLAAIVESSADAIMSTDVDDRIATWNPSAELLFGYDATEAVGHHVSLVVPPERREEMAEINAKVAAGEAVERIETVRLHADGRRIPVSLSVRPLHDDRGEVIGSSSTTRDLTERVVADRELRAAEVRFQAAFRRSSFGMAIADLDGYPTTVNRALCEMLDRRPDELVGHRWTAFTHPDHRPLGEAVTAHIDRGGNSYSDERRYLRPDGSVVWVQVNVNLVRGSDEDPQYFMLQMQDITARKDFESQLEHRALHDDLTGLPNRALLDDRLDHALAAGPRTGRPVGVAFVDVDGFKHVNDALGHAAGDRLLIEVGRRLGAAVRPTDTVARFGGDEFVLICEDITLPELRALAERITGDLSARFEVEGTDVALRASVGITVSRPGSTGPSLLSEADAAMYQAKERGAGQVAVFDDSLRTRAAARLEGERTLVDALAAGGIVAHYQPIVELRSGRTVGFEALARWRREDGSLVRPDEFIPLAETTGLIVRLGQVVLDQATGWAARWNALAIASEPCWVSVNLSARQLTDARLPETVQASLERSGLPPGLLHLEITESVLMENLDQAVSILQSLRDLGVRLAIDDFGTGYSSLAYLKRLPVDTLKIDRTFVSDLDVGDSSIINAVLALGQALGMACVAEGIESEEQRRTLIELGCRFGQGYLWSRPLPADDVAGWTAGRA